jgi:hypothetical protein
MAAIPVIIVAEELIAWAVGALAVGATAVAVSQAARGGGAAASRSGAASAASGGDGGDGCKCTKTKGGGGRKVTTKELDTLARNWGIERRELGRRIHAIKAQLERNPDVNVCPVCGNVFSPKSGDLIGNLRSDF